MAGCGKQYNLQDLNKSILLHQDLGFGPDLVDLKRRISYPTIPKQTLKYKIRLETLSEEMRILYVAYQGKRKAYYYRNSEKYKKYGSQLGKLSSNPGSKAARV